ncbi:glycosyltransferase [Aquimarina intermedia]|uniref:Glycosyltransferase involved in cell wall biosynthesis n=1 Tax=Aquimarina intermedia TaxID=350814 RepID=A0A5S5C7E8_9FLAO|nr:glycosyltransferase [Aquimarina intermedia]TYP75099.1 glycosyltransferase involved in cell wall biosynthesis [Aquimarina intermedia]
MDKSIMTSKDKLKKRFKIKKKISSPLFPSNKKANLSVMLITTFPPRECGIATYSKDLAEGLKRMYGHSMHLEICPLTNFEGTQEYPKDIHYFLNTASASSFKQLAQQINHDDTIDIVMIQHEFGLFSKNKTTFLEFLSLLKKTKILQFHTVLPQPENDFCSYVQRIIAQVDHVVVMTDSSKNLLTNEYHAKPDHISIINHGTHLIPHNDKIQLKKKYNLVDKTVLSTFGLLGPGKSIETTLDALPSLTKKYPDLIFLILGKTHPSLIEGEGEKYREFLIKKVNDLNITNNVKFINKFLPLNELLEYLQLTDVYLFTSKDPSQAVSGTFSYAMSCGCPIISTPIPHALEFLSENKGKIFEFGDSEKLAEYIEVLLKDPEYRKALGLNCLHASASSSWENIALIHGKLFEKFSKKSKLNFMKPPIELDHLERLTTSMGVIQFSNLNEPELKSGYTLDDNARALIAACKYYELTNEKTVLDSIEIYVSFILHCQRHDGSFLNYVDENGKFTPQNDTVNLEDANGRALWSLGCFINLKKILPKKFRYLLERAEESFNEFSEHIPHYNSPRALAFIIKGLYKKSSNECNISNEVTSIAQKLANMYKHESDDNWQWYESYFTYGNSVLPQSMLLAYEMTDIQEFKNIALNSFNFLLGHLFRKGKFNIISNKTWFKYGDSVHDLPLGGQQPVDVAYTLLALKTFHRHFPEKDYDKKMELSFSWFLGNNYLNQTVYNHLTKGCHDGIETININLNQGAESTISYLLARMAFEAPMR